MRPSPAACLLCCSAAVVAGGCAPATGPAVIVVPSSQYLEAFDAAVEAGRRNGMPPSLRDPRGGVIETEPAIAGSLLDPWRPGTTSASQAAEATLAYQRRRARFEFAPVRFEEPATPAESRDPLDLTAYTGSIELRVRVTVERAHTPGIRHGTWSRRQTTQASITKPGQFTRTKTFWTPVTSDEDLEARLLAAVQEAMGAGEMTKSREREPQARSVTEPPVPQEQAPPRAAEPGAWQE